MHYKYSYVTVNSLPILSLFVINSNKQENHYLSFLLLIFYSSFAVLIFNNLNISTIIIGANINIINSITFPVGNIEY